MHRTMRDRLTLFLAAAALLGAAGIAEAKSTTIKHQLVQQTNPSSREQTAGQMGQSGSQTQVPLPQGVSPKDYGNVRGDVRDTFSALAKATLSRDSFNDLRDQLAKADRDRLATNDNKYPDDLNRAIDQFNQAWKGKYNASFSIDKDSAYPDQFLAVTTGEVTNPQQVDHWPVVPLGHQAMPQTSNPTMNQGTGVAVATFSGGQEGQPPLHVSLVKEGNDWKIDIPDSVTADQLKSSLAQHLSEVTNMQGQWPQDQYQAQRIVTQHILMALYNLPSGQSSQQQSTMGGSAGEHTGQSQSTENQNTQTSSSMSGQGSSTDQNSEQNETEE